MIPDIRDFERLSLAFHWMLPANYNIGVDVTDKWAAREKDRPAIFDVLSDGAVKTITFGDLSRRSNQVANFLRARGVKAGDRVGVLLPQVHEVAVAHAAIFKLGAISTPLALLFGEDALRHRLQDAGISAVVTCAAGLAKLRAIDAPLIHTFVSIDGAEGQALGYDKILAEASPYFEPAPTGPDTPALMIYTSGSTGPAKGALHGHRVLLGHLPGVQVPHEFFPQPGDLFWTPADWAWAGGLLNAMLPALHFGVAIIAKPTEKFDPESAFDLMARFGVRNVFAPPTALRMMRTIENPREKFTLALRTLGSAGEALGEQTYHWARTALGMTINEYYGQTECNLVLGSCAALQVSRAGSMGKAMPGHEVAIIRPDGSRCQREEIGQIAVRRPDPVMFLNYWNNCKATQEKFIKDWMTTGDQGFVDRDGYFYFVGRDDDVITSAGYRIGPGEIEECLLRHPAIALAAAVGVQDYLRTEIVKAFVVLRRDFTASDALASELQAHVRQNLAPYCMPREIVFVDALPLTTSGKIMRRLLRD